MKGHLPALPLAAAILSASIIVSARTFTVKNDCSFTVWPALFTDPSASSRPSQGTGWEASAGSEISFDVPDDWRAGRIWGRTDCDFSTNSNSNSCSTGGCEGGLECTSSGVPPASLAEFTLITDQRDFYDVSLVAGYNLPMAITNNVGCIVADCINDVNTNCPTDLALKGPSGGVVGCNSCIVSQGSTNSANTTDTCTKDSALFYFKDSCPNSYVSTNDISATRSCDSGLKANYVLTFCPSFDVEQSPVQSQTQSSAFSTGTTTQSISTATPIPTTTSIEASESQRLSAGTIGGIAGGLGSFAILVGCVVWFMLKRRQRRRYFEKDDSVPNPFYPGPGQQSEFNPYGDETISPSNGITIPLNPKKRSRDTSVQNSAATASPDSDQAQNLRWGNLKLQQRVAVLLGRSEPLPQSQPQEDNPIPQEHRRREPRMHTDSGWRMGQQDELASNHSDDTEEVPPNYTEI